MSFCSALLESTVIKFWSVNEESKVFPGKVNLEEGRYLFCFKMNTLLFCVSTFRVDCEMYSLSDMRSNLSKRR